MSYLNVPSQPSGRAHLTRATNTRLSGRWLILARVVWIALVVCILAYFIAGLPAIFETLHQPCVGVWCTNAVGRLTVSQMHALVKAGISLGHQCLVLSPFHRDHVARLVCGGWYPLLAPLGRLDGPAGRLHADRSRCGQSHEFPALQHFNLAIARE